MHWIRNRGWISETRALELYPPFFLMRVKVVEVSEGWRQIRLRLPLNAFSRNPGGAMFGGYQAAVADPVAALACARVFPGYDVWTRELSVDFRRRGSTDLELRFDFPPDQEITIGEQLESRGSSTPSFEYGFHLADGTLCTAVRSVVAIRPRGYSAATQPPAA